MTQPSPLYQLIESKLPVTLLDYVAARWPSRSWQEIADEIREQMGVRVHRETLRVWFADRLDVHATVRAQSPGSAA